MGLENVVKILMPRLDFFDRFIAFCASSDTDLVNKLPRGSPKTYQRNQQRQSLQFIRIQNSKSKRYPKIYHKPINTLHSIAIAIYQHLKFNKSQ